MPQADSDPVSWLLTKLRALPLRHQAACGDLGPPGGGNPPVTAEDAQAGVGGHRPGSLRQSARSIPFWGSPLSPTKYSRLMVLETEFIRQI